MKSRWLEKSCATCSSSEMNCCLGNLLQAGADMSDKSFEACRAYAKASDDIKRLTKSIGSALSKCKGVNGNLWSFNDSEDETHLKAHYRLAAHGGEGYFHYGERSPLEDCEHCAKAAQLVKERRKARQSLGAAKRWIVRIGKDGA